MNRKQLVILMIIVAFEVLRSTSAHADVATNLGSSQVALFFREGESIVRTFCRADSVIYDRATCQTALHAVPANEFYDALGGDFGGDAEQWERRIREYYVKIDRIDLKLLELINAEPNPSGPDVLEQIEAKQRQLAETDGKVAEIQDQIARIQRSLSQRENPDLRRQLQALQIELADKVAAQTTQREALHRLRDEYVQANSDVINADTLRDLSAQRHDVVSQIDDAKGSLAREMKELASVARTFSFVADQGFTYEVMQAGNSYNDLKPVARRMNEIFLDLSLRFRTFGGVLGGSVVVIEVPRSGEVEAFDCRLETEPLARCTRLEIHQPNDFRNPLDGLSLHYTPAEMSHAVLRPMLRQDPQGTWEIKPLCDMIASRVVRSFTCKMVLK